MIVRLEMRDLALHEDFNLAWRSFSFVLASAPACRRSFQTKGKFRDIIVTKRAKRREQMACALEGERRNEIQGALSFFSSFNDRNLVEFPLRRTVCALEFIVHELYRETGFLISSFRILG